ncbi:MAG: large-conductance mechanosensitive channel protein MscL [Phycisphaerales bacterium JB059]
MGIIKEFKDFAMRGNVMDMAVGIIIGAAFGKIVSSLVSDIIMPPIGMIMGGVDFADLKLTIQEGTAETVNEAGETVAAVAPVTINYGTFINVLLDFLIVAFAIFMVIKMMNKATEAMKKKEVEAPAEEPKVSTTDQLLMEIRDSLKSNG